jgi:hypothetical protein
MPSASGTGVGEVTALRDFPRPVLDAFFEGVLAAFFEGVLARRPLLLFVRGGICLVFLILRFPLFYN